MIEGFDGSGSQLVRVEGLRSRSEMGFYRWF